MCDKEEDCLNGKDERHCDLKPCADDGSFRCIEEADSSTSTAACLPVTARCDGHLDCPQGSDERSCQGNEVNCHTGQFKCKNGACLENDLVCNNEKDCSDGEDEMGCMFCSAAQFPCKSVENNRTTKCIPRMYLCDGINDCEDGWDERVNDCKYADGTSSSSQSDSVTKSNRSTTTSTTTSTASSNRDDHTPMADGAPHCNYAQWSCANGHCIDFHRRCDRNFDCSDRSDELFCKLFFNAAMSCLLTVGIFFLLIQAFSSLPSRPLAYRCRPVSMIVTMTVTLTFESTIRHRPRW